MLSKQIVRKAIEELLCKSCFEVLPARGFFDRERDSYYRGAKDMEEAWLIELCKLLQTLNLKKKWEL